MRTLNNYPVEFTNNRQSVEGSFIFCLWKSPELYGDYVKIVDSDRDFLLPESRFYYTIGKEMSGLGYVNFDNNSVLTYLDGKNELLKIFNGFGGYETVESMKNILDIDNIDAYYDELAKSNMLVELYDSGFDLTKIAKKFNDMTSQQAYDYCDYIISDSTLKTVNTGLQIVDLASGYEEWVDKWDTGEGIGYKVGYPMLNYHLAGIHKKNLILHLAGIGQGKTTSAISTYVIPVLESGESICILANEQDEEQFRQMLLATVLFNKIGYFKMNRQKFLFGGFSKDDRIAINKAIDWLRQYEGQLHYGHLTDYRTESISRVIKKYSKIGVGIFLIDTLKPEDETSEKSWAEFSETSKELFLLSQKEDVAIIATAQLSGVSSSRKFLDLSCIGKSKAIAETAGQVIMFRPITQKEKETMQVYTYAKDTQGKYMSVKNIIQLNPEKDYIVLFIAKNRYGKADVQIVYERNMDFNTMKELGYTNVEHDGFGGK